MPQHNNRPSGGTLQPVRGLFNAPVKKGGTDPFSSVLAGTSFATQAKDAAEGASTKAVHVKRKAPPGLQGGASRRGGGRLEEAREAQGGTAKEVGDSLDNTAAAPGGGGSQGGSQVGQCKVSKFDCVKRIVNCHNVLSI